MGVQLVAGGKLFSAADLRRLGFPAFFRVTSREDDSPAVVTATTVTPSAVNTTTTAQTVTVNVTASDPQSGVASVSAVLNTWTNVYEQHGAGARLRLHHLTGNNWTATVGVPPCAVSGRYTAQAWATNHANGGSTGQRSNPLHVTSTRGAPDMTPRVSAATASAGTGMVTLTFNEGVKNVTATTLKVFAVSADGGLGRQLPVIGIVCSDASTTVACNGSAAVITSAQLNVAGLSPEATIWANQDSITSQLTSRFGYPMDWNDAAASVTAA
jgi:hypothetical protein